jgi:hypothetical protein
LPNYLFAQYLLKGYVKESKHIEPMSHVNVYLKNSTMGSMTQEDGSFMLLLQDNPPIDTLIFSYIGYKDFKIALSQIHQPWNLSVLLEENNVNLPTVVITPLKIEKILQQSIDNFDKNHLQTNVDLKGFIKVVVQLEDKIERMLYADMVLSADKKGAFDLSFLSYQFQKAAPSDIPLLDAMTTALLLDNLNLKKYLTIWTSKLSKFDSTAVHSTTFGDYGVYELDLRKNIAPQKKYQVKLFLEQETKAIIAVQIYGDKIEPKSVAKTTTGQLTRVYRSSVGAIHYRPYNGKWILSEVKADLTSDCALTPSQQQGSKVFVHNARLEMGISECVNLVEPKQNTKRIRSNKDIFSQVELIYNKKWKQTPHLTTTELQFLNQN